MRVSMYLRNVLASATALALCIALVGRATATPVAYTIDPTRSSLTLTGDVFGAPIVPITGPGNLVDSFHGTIVADLTAGVLTFSGGTSIIGNLNPTAPFPGVPAGAGVDNYGMTNGIIGATVFRDSIFDLTAGTVTDGAVPAGMNVLISSLNFASVALGSGSFAGGTEPNSTALAASLTTVGNIETLVLPFRRESGTTTHFVSTGIITATRQIPEPSTMVLAGLGMIGVCVAAWRKRRAV